MAASEAEKDTEYAKRPAAELIDSPVSGRFLEEAAGVNAELLPKLAALQLHEDGLVLLQSPAEQ